GARAGVLGAARPAHRRAVQLVAPLQGERREALLGRRLPGRRGRARPLPPGRRPRPVTGREADARQGPPGPRLRARARRAHGRGQGRGHPRRGAGVLSGSTADQPAAVRSPTPRVGAVVVAAGSGSRLGADVPKALVPVGGVPLVVHAVARLLGSGVSAVVVAAPAAFVDQFRVALAEVGRAAGRVTVVAGGASRQASVAAALAALPAADVVLVHDAARCFAPPAMIERVVDAVRAGHRAVIPVAPVVDTLVASADEGPAGAYADRSLLRAVQTPQGFARECLERAHAAAPAADEASAATDDASLAAALGETVWTVPGDDAAMKITTPR